MYTFVYICARRGRILSLFTSSANESPCVWARKNKEPIISPAKKKEPIISPKELDISTKEP